jgi:UDP-3-O-[3-hydroxymyristoyl] glucosamine N-acyltransferase
MLIKNILDFDPSLTVKHNKYTDFTVIGNINSNESGLLTYCRDNDGKDLELALKMKNIVALIVREEIKDFKTDITLIYSSNPYADFYLFHQYLLENTDFYSEKVATKIALSACIHSSAIIEGDNIQIGENTNIGPNVTIYENSMIGDNVTIGAGCVIGAESLQYVRKNGEKYRITHKGGVIIGDDTYMGSNNVIVKSCTRSPRTIIGEKVAIANLVMVGHSVTIEDGAQIISNVVLGGGCTIRKNARVSFGSNVSNHVVVGENAWVTIGAVVTKNVPVGQKVSGNFAILHEKQIEHVKRISQ